MTAGDTAASDVPGAQDTTAVVTRAFSNVLGLDEVGPDEDFFDLGGHSVMAMRLIALITESSGADLSVRDVFEAPTPAELAARIAS